ncbi:MAG: archaellin/type IV pilin N-terminal domain-containing protein [Candidatus Nezhaarchaeales archaeon]
MSKKPRNIRKAVSPVIATIIIVAVAIVMSIAAAYWVMGLTAGFTRYEKLEFVSAYPIKDGKCFNISITVKNTGTSPATITKFLLNGVPDDIILAENDHEKFKIYYYNGTKFEEFKVGNNEITINPGESEHLKISISDGAKIGAGTTTSGLTLEVTIQTANGYQYSKSIVLP